MPDPVVCTSCRSAIRIPADHTESTIRCGICWAENAVGPKPNPIAVAVARPMARAVAAKPSIAEPGKAAPGMAKLEQLIHRAGEKLAPPVAPRVPVAAKSIVATVEPFVPEVVAPARPAAAFAMPVAIPQAPVPTPVRVMPSVPPVVVEAIPVTQPTVAPVAIPSRPVEAPVPVTISPVVDARPVVPGEYAETPISTPRVERGTERRSPVPRRTRDEDDDEDYDRRAAGPPRGLIVGGIAFLLLLGVGGYFLIRTLAPSNTNGPGADAAGPQLQFERPNPNANNAPPNPNGFGFNPFPNNLPKFEPPKVRIEWVDRDGDGYKAKFPGTPFPHASSVPLHDGKGFVGVGRTTTHRAEVPPAVTAEVTTFDAPQGMKPDLKRVIAHPTGRGENAIPCRFAGQSGFELEEMKGDRTSTSRCVQVGRRVFLFKLTVATTFPDQNLVETAKKTFWESISITHDPAAPGQK